MREFDFIRSIQQQNYRNSEIIKGIGDDAAIFRQPYRHVVTAVDTFVENVHFSKETMSLFQVGYRALAANISDMAAMGAEPISYLVSIVIPKKYSSDDLKEIYLGLHTIAKDYQLDLIGGDTVTGNALVLSVTINGAVNQNRIRYRSLMQPDDIIFVTGTLGDSAAGLDILLNKHTDIKNSDYLIERHQLPTPRVNFSSGLKNINRVALNDISDGLASEANELAEASQLSIYLDASEMPRSDALKQFSMSKQLNYILNGGEDFELIGSVSPTNWGELRQVAEKTNTPIKKVGYVKNEDNQGKVFLKKDTQIEVLEATGYVHEN